MASSYQLVAAFIPAEKRGELFSIFNATFFLSWGVAATCITGPLTDILIAMGRTQVFACRFRTGLGTTRIHLTAIDKFSFFIENIKIGRARSVIRLGDFLCFIV